LDNAFSLIGRADASLDDKIWRVWIMSVHNRVGVTIRPVQGADLTAYRDPNFPATLPILRVAGVGTSGLTPVPSGDVWEAHNVTEPIPISSFGTLTFEGLFNVGLGTYYKFGIGSPFHITIDGTESELGNPGLSGSFTATNTIHEKVWIMTDRNGLQGPYVVNIPTNVSPEPEGSPKSDYDSATPQDQEQEYNWRLSWGTSLASDGEKPSE
jgi:hypothetical protein